MNPTQPEEPTVISTAVEEPDDFQAMLLGAALIFGVSFIPYASFSCCLPYILAALLAVHLFTRKYGLTVSYGRGIKLGILTCLMGGLATWAVMLGIQLVFDYQVGRKEVETLTLWLVEKTGNPDAVRQAREGLEAQRAQGVTVGQVVGGLVGVGVFASLSGLLGGVLGAALFKRGPKVQNKSAV
jgi:hypothetical protein